MLTAQEARKIANDGKCIFCYCNRDGMRKNLKSSYCDKIISNNNSCDYFLNFYSFD